MKKFDADNLTPLTILTILTTIACLFAVWFWLNQKIYDFDGARGMAVDNNGVTHIQVGNRFYRYNDAGDALPSVDLTELGVVDFLGDLSFNDKNELLLRRSSYKTSFLDNIKIMLRLRNTTTLEAGEGDGLSLCSLDSMKCRPFGSSAHDFNRGFFSAYNKADGTTFVSDASRHELHKFDADGHFVASIKEGLIFPNELVVEDNALYIVESSRGYVKQLDTQTQKFGALLNEYSVTNSDTRKSKFKLPYYLVKAGELWWVIILDKNMANGGVYLYDKDWFHIKTLPMGADALPVALLSRKNEVLLTDIESPTVARYSPTGDYLGVVEHAQMNAALGVNAKQRQFYKMAAKLYVAAVVFVFVVILFVAIRKKFRESAQQMLENSSLEPANEIRIDRVSSEIKWLDSRAPFAPLKRTRMMQIVSLILIVVVTGGIWFFVQSHADFLVGFEGMDNFVYLTMAGVGGFALLASEGVRVRLGVYKNQLILHDQVSNKSFAASGEAIMHDNRNVAFGELYIKVNQANRHKGNQRVVELSEDALQILEGATTLKSDTMTVWYWRNANQLFLSPVLKIALLMVIVLVWQVNRY